MILRSITASLCAAAFTFSLQAQDNCPFERVQHNPSSLQLGPAQGCGGISYQIGEITMSTVRDACPQFSIYTPPHDIAVKSEYRTMVKTVALQPITEAFFTCRMDWFLILPLGSNCAFVRQVNAGTVQLLTTTPCPEHDPT